MSILDQLLPTPTPIWREPPPRVPGVLTDFTDRLAADDRSALLSGRRVEAFEPGETIWRGGETGNVLVLTAGVTAAMAPLADGLEAGSALHLPGSTPGLAEALAGQVRAERGVALTVVRGVRLSSTAVRRLWRDSASFREASVAQVAAEAACARRWCACQSRHGVDERVAGLLIRLHLSVGSDSVKTTQEVAAAALGVQRTTVSQSASKLQNIGAVRWRRGAVDVLDAAKLERAACDCATES